MDTELLTMYKCVSVCANSFVIGFFLNHDISCCIMLVAMLFSFSFVVQPETERGPERSCRINTQGSQLELERCHTNTTTTRVAYGNSHLACE